MGNISQSFYRDLVAARRQQHADRIAGKAGVKVERLTKKGTINQMEDPSYFANEADAQIWIESIRKMNPTREFNYRITILKGESK